MQAKLLTLLRELAITDISENTVVEGGREKCVTV